MNKIPMLEKFAAQSLVEHNGELIFSKEKFAELIVRGTVPDRQAAAGSDDATIPRQRVVVRPESRESSAQRR